MTLDYRSGDDPLVLLHEGEPIARFSRNNADIEIDLHRTTDLQMVLILATLGASYLPRTNGLPTNTRRNYY